MTDTPELEHGDGHDVSPVGDIHSFPSDAELSRSLMASSAAGVLSTLTTEGYPYGSLVSHMVDGDGNPIILISDLAEHTKNARLDNRASLLVDTSRAADEDPLVGARLTLIGQMNLLAASDDLQATYLEKHPYAADYLKFKDFNFWQLEVERCRFVGGFGHMSWMTAGDYCTAEEDPFCQNALGAIEHMNDDHADANLIFVQERGGIPNAREAEMIGVDRYGMTFRVASTAGDRTSRVAFTEVATDPSQLEPFVIGLLRSLRDDS
ncbi:MAG: DUF2470 domain-containing protein [Acidimicrobiales bacterium]|nr:DUF2470 domain-containing protein [Acidimicrobiales bacterium]|tara:strand:+ start:113 stop:907 length:795 start_codon:yes stop_codon:yes gene_type:complete